ncbi:hypothetical protein BsWGS_20220 [Bradybaena similaris]
MAALIRCWGKVACVGFDTFLIASKSSSNRFVRCGSSSSAIQDFLQLSQRGLCESVFPDTRLPDLEDLLSRSQSLYCGFDPTADSLHIGNLLSLIVLLHGQRAGHSPIAVIGGATAMIGDPSGKTNDRVAIVAEEVENNVLAIMENIQRVVTNHRELLGKEERQLPEFRILNNNSWYKNRDVISFLASIGRHFRVGDMMARHSVKSRLNSKEGLSCTEFLYQIFQAYDWLHLFEQYNCTLQVGGNDQTGNVSSGFDLIRKVHKKYVFGLMVPLMLSSSGEKLGKSAGNSMWLSPSKTSPYELYQYFFNTQDNEVERYLQLFTFLSFDEIAAVLQEQNEHPDQRPGQKKLAEQITLLVHGNAGLDSARRCTDVLFGNSMAALTSMKLPELLQLLKDAPTTELVYDPQLTVCEMCLKIKCFKEESAAMKIIREGGLYINQQRVTQQSQTLGSAEYVLPSDITLVRVGKKTYHIVKWCR